MKRALILVIGLVFLTSTVSAEPLIMRTGCDVLSPDGKTTFFAIGKEVIKTGNKATITCKGTLPADMAKPDREIRLEFENTGIYYQTDQYEFNHGLAYNWMEEIMPSGHFILKVTVDIKPSV